MDDFHFDCSYYSKTLVLIGDIFRKLSKHEAAKGKIIEETFCESAWEKLTKLDKAKHSANNCKECVCTRGFEKVLSQFPMNGNAYKSKTKKYGLIRKSSKDITNLSMKEKEQQIKRKAVKQIEEIKKSTAVAR